MFCGGWGVFSIMCGISFFFFFFNDTATTEIYTLSLHDALPICRHGHQRDFGRPSDGGVRSDRSEEHTSELQSRRELVCRLLLEKKKKNPTDHINAIIKNIKNYNKMYRPNA